MADATKKHTERAHALLSASGSSRWLNCTPSARLEEEHGRPEVTSDFAAEGTLAHELAELLLLKHHGRIADGNYLIEGKRIRDHRLYSDEMPKYVEQYRDYVNEVYAVALKNDPAASLLIEERIDLTDYIPEGFGSNDAIVLSDKHMHVIDLKYGKGIAVDADDNPQLMLYGLGALAAHGFYNDIETITLAIVQPRLDHISEFEISAADLLAFGETQVKPKAKEAFEGAGDAKAGDAKAGDWCRWCKFKGKCAAYAETVLRTAREEFADAAPENRPDPRVLTNDQIVQAYKLATMFADWYKGVTGHMLAGLLEGETFPGYKAVNGRALRKWKDDAAAIAELSKEYSAGEILNTKIKGFGDLEKLVGKKAFAAKFADYIERPEGKPTIAKESDKRIAVTNKTAEEIFGDE